MLLRREISPRKFTIESNIQQTGSLPSKIRKIQPLLCKLSTHIQGLAITAVFGSTGTGKSSLISYLLGAQTQYQKVKGGKYQIINQKNKGNYPKIGHQKSSCTTIPQIYSIKNQHYVDLPGFFDTRIEDQEIINSICSSKLFVKYRKVKIIIVVGASELSNQRGGQLVQILNRITKIFENDFKKMMKSVILVVTKVDTQECNLQNLTEDIDQITKLNQNLYKQGKELITRLIQFERIYLFPLPNLITHHISTIKKSLSLMSQYSLSNDCKVALSDKAQNSIDSMKLNLNRQLKKIGDFMFNHMKKSLLSNYKDSSFGLKKKMSLVQKYLNFLTSRLITSYYSFRNFVQFLQSQLNVDNYLIKSLQKNVEMISCYNNIGNNNKQQFEFITHMERKGRQIFQSLKAKKHEHEIKQQRQQLQFKLLIKSLFGKCRYFQYN